MLAHRCVFNSVSLEFFQPCCEQKRWCRIETGAQRRGFLIPCLCLCLCLLLSHSDWVTAVQRRLWERPCPLATETERPPRPELQQWCRAAKEPSTFPSPGRLCGSFSTWHANNPSLSAFVTLSHNTKVLPFPPKSDFPHITFISDMA